MPIAAMSFAATFAFAIASRTVATGARRGGALVDGDEVGHDC
jgi:hypothetical protein